MVFGNPMLKAFLAVVETGTTHAAAEKLHITQTAVTQRIKNLERSLGVDVFIRTKKGMQLNPPGKVLLNYAKKLQRLALAGHNDITGLGSNAKVSVTLSAATTIMQSRVLPAITPILNKYPMLYIKLDADDNPKLEDKLLNFQSDIIISENIHLSDQTPYKPLAPDDMILVCSPAWKKRKLLDIIQQERIIDYNESDHLTFAYLRKYKLLEHAQHDRIFANRTELIAQMIECELGYSVLSKAFIKHYCSHGQLHVLNQGLSYAHQLVCAWMPQDTPAAYIQTLLHALT